VSSAVVIDDLDLVGIVVAPDEAKTPLVIDTNAVLAVAVATQSFQTVAGGARNAAIWMAASSMSSFRRAARSMARQRVGVSPSNTFRVSASRKLRIIRHTYNVQRIIVQAVSANAHACARNAVMRQ